MRTVLLPAIVLPGFLLMNFPAVGAVTEGWVQRYSNPTTRLADGEAFKVVVDSAGNVVATGFILDDNHFKGMFTIKYSGVDGSVLWQKHFDSAYESEGTALALDGSGNVIVTAFAQGDYYTAKYAAGNGATLWEHRFSGPAGEDFPKAIAVDGNGDVIVTGYSDNGMTNEMNSRVYYTAKYAAADGALVWEQRHHSPSHYGEGQAVAVDAAGNILVTGMSHGSNSGDFYTVKYAAADGAVLWDHRYNGPTNALDRAVAVAVDSSGDVIVTGVSHNGRNNDVYTAKYAGADGALLWEKRFDGPGEHEDSAIALAVAGNGDVIVTGESYVGDEAAFDYYTARYAGADGALLWEKFSTSPEFDYATAVAVDDLGNVIVTGVSISRDTGHDYYTVKYAAADGALLWDKRFDGPGHYDEVAHSLAVDHAGNVVVTGLSEGFYYHTIKYGADDGAPLWEKFARVPADYPDFGRAIALDGNGNVVVTARSIRDQGNADFYTVKYARTTGTILWERRHDGPEDKGDDPYALVVDRNGNVIVTGSTWEDVTGLDFYTVKYAAASGAILWEKGYNSASTNADAGTAVVVDLDNNIVVTGYSGSNTNYDYYTAKYAGTDGTLLWEKRFNGPAQAHDIPAALALDGNGNVIVTGTSWNRNSTNPSDFYTVKYAAADGAVLWDRRYDGPSKRLDEAAALAIDPGDNVIVTGTSESDYCTVKYAAADGDLLWEKLYNGTNDLHDAAYAVVADSSGNVIVAGTSSDAGYWQLHTIKYAAADGTFLWDRTTPGQATVGVPCALAIDSADDVVLAGSVSRPPPENYQDYCAVKFAGANGAVLWEKNYDGPGLQSETLAGHGLAIRDGMIALTGTSAGDPPDHSEALGSPHSEIQWGGPARHVVHYEMATVVFWEKVPPVFLERVPSGIRLHFRDNPDSTYQVQRAAVVTGPWDTIATVTVPDEGFAEYIDTDPLAGMAFYRLSTP